MYNGHNNKNRLLLLPKDKQVELSNSTKNLENLIGNMTKDLLGYLKVRCGWADKTENLLFSV